MPKSKLKHDPHDPPPRTKNSTAKAVKLWFSNSWWYSSNSQTSEKNLKLDKAKLPIPEGGSSSSLSSQEPPNISPQTCSFSDHSQSCKDNALNEFVLSESSDETSKAFLDDSPRSMSKRELCPSFELAVLFGQRRAASSLMRESAEIVVVDNTILNARQGKNRRFQNFSQTRAKGYEIEDLSDDRYIRFLYK